MTFSRRRILLLVAATAALARSRGASALDYPNRPVRLIVGLPAGGAPAGAKTKVQELIERDQVDVILGPLAAFELLAISDYISQQKTPLLSLAAADNLTQRKPNPYFLRASATSSQAMQPLGHYAATELKLKRVITISEDFAFGHEQMGGFQASFAKDGGCVVNKLWPPLVTPDYTPYIAQIADCDAVCQGFAGSNPLRFMKQYASAGLKYPVIAGEAGADDFLLKSFGEEAVGLVSADPSANLTVGTVWLPPLTERTNSAATGSRSMSISV